MDEYGEGWFQADADSFSGDIMQKPEESEKSDDWIRGYGDGLRRIGYELRGGIWRAAEDSDEDIPPMTRGKDGGDGGTMDLKDSDEFKSVIDKRFESFAEMEAVSSSRSRSKCADRRTSRHPARGPLRITTNAARYGFEAAGGSAAGHQGMDHSCPSWAGQR